MNDRDETAGQLEVIGEAAEVLRDASLRCQDLLDELENERAGRWAAYTGFRGVGASYRSALEQLRSLTPVNALRETLAAYIAGAHAGVEAAADFAEALEQGHDEPIERGIERLTLASQHFVRGRHLLQQLLEGRDRSQ
jgi:hypothetical protein